MTLYFNLPTAYNPHCQTHFTILFYLTKKKKIRKMKREKFNFMILFYGNRFTRYTNVEIHFFVNCSILYQGSQDSKEVGQEKCKVKVKSVFLSWRLPLLLLLSRSLSYCFSRKKRKTNSVFSRIFRLVHLVMIFNQVLKILTL